MTCSGKEYKKEWVYVYALTDSLCCVAETNTILKISYTLTKVNFYKGESF